MLIVKNPYLDALIAFILTFSITYIFRLLIEGGNYPFSENWITHLAIATGLTLGLSVLPSLHKFRKAKN